MASTDDISADQELTCLLVRDNWNDWWTFQTMFTLWILQPDGQTVRIGSLKIAEFGQKGTRELPSETKLPSEFNELPDSFYSVGQDEDYYQTLLESFDGVRATILSALKDVAFDLSRLDRSENEEASTMSVFRSVSPNAIRERLNRLAHGNAKLSDYGFTYQSGAKYPDNTNPIFSFSVSANSTPPTNIHAIIGRNGVGKTRLFRQMISTLLEDETEDEVGNFENIKDNSGWFPSVTLVTFSAFDTYIPPSRVGARVHLEYVGLSDISSDKPSAPRPTKGPGTGERQVIWKNLQDAFLRSVSNCAEGRKRRRWDAALETLSSDPILDDIRINFCTTDPAELCDQAKREFESMSSGHKIVLSTITRLIDVVGERSLVLIDEPENHLHPPLLAAFVRALSAMLLSQNAVAIIATHSPVVLQEIPGSCVWLVQRSGNASSICRPRRETFGENVGTLTREVFGHEVLHSGFNSLVEHVFARTKRYNETLESFGGQLGSEARVLLRVRADEVGDPSARGSQEEDS